MKKAGVVTICKEAVDESFGPAVQILAVQQYLKKYDIDAETIVDNNNKRNVLQNILRVLDELKKGKDGIKFVLTKIKGTITTKGINIDNEMVNELIKKRKESYKKYIDKYIKISMLKEEDLFVGSNQIKGYDYFVVGSDQVWNPYYPQVDSIKYLKFCKREKRVAFSPSIARNDIPKRFRKSFTDGISGFNNISIREDRGRLLIKKYTGKDAEVLLDPTMLVENKFWRSIEEAPKNVPSKKYVLAYFMGDFKKRILEDLAKSKNFDIVWLRDFNYPEQYILNPMEYLYLIDHAELICTDSFHMTVFSILFKRLFVVFERDKSGGGGMSSRLDTLLEKFNMSGRRFSDKESCWKEIDFSKNDEILEKERKKAKAFFDRIFLEVM